MATSFSELWAFRGSSAVDGAEPVGTLVMDSGGALYGTTFQGGLPSCSHPSGCGVVFKLAPPAKGKTAWSETILYRFQAARDGGEPLAGLTIDASGALYGVTASGGTAGHGIAFKLMPPAKGQTRWKEKVLHSFAGGVDDGNDPLQPMVLDAKGTLYGTTRYGGTADEGTVYSLKPPPGGNGAWTFKLLYSFKGGLDGAEPESSTVGLAMTPGGALFGTTSTGGTGSLGTVFILVPHKGGPWTEQVLYSFVGGAFSGRAPAAGVVLRHGMLYGTTLAGGPGNDGIVYQLAPPAGPTEWNLTILHGFADGGGGAHPRAGVFFDKAGTLYSTTISGGNGTCDPSGCGTIFRLKPPAHGSHWSYAVLHRFLGFDGASPYSSLVADKSGLLYGSTTAGGDSCNAVAINGCGVLFRLKP